MADKKLVIHLKLVNLCNAKVQRVKLKQGKEHTEHIGSATNTRPYEIRFKKTKPVNFGQITGFGKKFEGKLQVVGTVISTQLFRTRFH